MYVERNPAEVALPGHVETCLLMLILNVHYHLRIHRGVPSD
jgi:hypothetical protein